MNYEEFLSAAEDLAKYLADYRDNLQERRIVPQVKPGYLPALLPSEPPMQPQPWAHIMADLDNIVMPGVTHWQHPHFHAYFANGATFEGVLSHMLTTAFGVNQTSWMACPVATELEQNVLDWIARAFGLPKQFLSSEPGSTGGGMHTTSASEAILCAMLAARAQGLAYLKSKNANPNIDETELLHKLVSYCSTETHSSTEKAAMICLVQLRSLDVDENFALRGDTVKKAIEEDMAKGLLPFFVVGTVGTTGTTAIDNIDEIGQITKDMPCCWLHIDGAYGGSSFCCPELRGPMKGFENVDSFNFNANKWFLLTPECSSLFVKDITKLKSSLVEDCTLHEPEEREYRHWGIAVGRQFRALHIWMTLKALGLETIQETIRNHCKLAKRFEGHVRKDGRFEVLNDVKLSCVAFRLKGRSNDFNDKLLDKINFAGKVHMIPTVVHGQYVLRFVVTYRLATKKQIDFAWQQIQQEATDLLAAEQEKAENEAKQTGNIDESAEQALLSKANKALQS